MRDQVGAALILVLHIGPFRLGVFLRRGNGVDAAGGQPQRKRCRQHDLAEATERHGFSFSPAVLEAERSRSEEHTSELQSLMRISYAVFCLKKHITQTQTTSSVT